MLVRTGGDRGFVPGSGRSGCRCSCLLRATRLRGGTAMDCPASDTDASSGESQPRRRDRRLSTCTWSPQPSTGISHASRFWSLTRRRLREASAGHFGMAGPARRPRRDRAPRDEPSRCSMTGGAGSSASCSWSCSCWYAEPWNPRCSGATLQTMRVAALGCALSGPGPSRAGRRHERAAAPDRSARAARVSGPP